MLTPAHAWVGAQSFADILQASWQRAIGAGAEPRADVAVAGAARFAAHESVSPLQRLEHGLHPWVAFVIMPVFALANAGVTLSAASVGEPVAVAIAVALAVGKPVGILLLCVVAVRLRVTELPAGVTWGMLVGGACLAGIGFTMALFLNTLAFPVDQYAVMESAGKVGTLAGSVASAVIGAAVLARALAR